MTLALPAAFTEALEQGTVQPVHIVSIEVGNRVYIDVTNNGVAAGASATLTLNGTLSFTVTEGVDFAAGATGEETAANMAAAFLDAFPVSQAIGPGLAIPWRGITLYARGARVTAIVDPADTLTSGVTGGAWADSSDTTGTVRYTTGPEPFGDYDPAVLTVMSYGAEVDPLKGGVLKPDEREVVWHDEGNDSPLRLLMERYPDLRGKVVRLQIGFEDLPEASFVDDGVYVIEEIKPTNYYTPTVTMILADLGTRLRGTKVRVNVINRHPLEAIEQVLVAAGVPAALYDSSSLDPSAYPDIGHFCVSRHGFGPGWSGVSEVGTVVQASAEYSNLGQRHPHGQDGREVLAVRERSTFGQIVEPIRALDLVNDLLQLLDGILVPDESGVYTFRRHDPAGAPAVTLTPETDYTGLEVEEMFRGLYNRVQIKGPHALDGNSIVADRAEQFSAGRHTEAGGLRYERTLEVSSEWLTAVGFLHGASQSQQPIASSDGPGTELWIRFGPANGFSGLRHSTRPAPLVSPPAFVQDVNTDASTDRPVYLMIFDPESGAREYVRAEAATVGANANAATGTWWQGVYTIAERGLFGTTALDWDTRLRAALVADATIGLDIASRLLGRVSNGLPLITLDAGPHLRLLQVGDRFALDADRWLDNGVNGIGEGTNTTAIFRIIRKETKDSGASPGIALRAQLVRYDITQPIRITTERPTIPGGGGRRVRNEFSLEVNGSKFVDCGDVSSVDGEDFAYWAGWVRSVGALTDGTFLSRMDAGQESFAIRNVAGEVAVDIGSGATIETNTTPLASETWHHIVVVFDNGNVEIYVDGLLQTTTVSGAIPATMPSVSSSLRFGSDSDSAAEFWTGRLDEWLIGAPGFAIDADQVLELYQPILDVTAMPSVPLPDHQWRFEGDYRDSLGGAHGTPSDPTPFFSSNTPP